MNEKHHDYYLVGFTILNDRSTYSVRTTRRNDNVDDCLLVTFSEDHSVYRVDMVQNIVSLNMYINHLCVHIETDTPNWGLSVDEETLGIILTKDSQKNKTFQYRRDVSENVKLEHTCNVLHHISKNMSRYELV